MHIRTLALPSLVLMLSLPACGGSKPAAETPADADAAQDEGADAEASKDAAPEPEAEPEPEPEPEAAGVDPEEILIREGTAFVLNIGESDIGKKIDEKCAKQAGDDIAKKSNCRSKAINSMDREGFLFEQKNGAWWYVRFGIIKGAKAEFNKVQIEVGEPQGNKLTIKTSGQDKASRRRGTVPKELEFEVPDEYTIILHDPKRGKLVFDPKMGLFDSE